MSRSTSKYLNKKTELDGYTFDSNREAQRWAELQLLERAGDIEDLKRQVGFILAPAVRFTPEGRQKPALKYWADFCYVDVKRGGRVVVEDVKSKATAEKEAFRIKLHLMKALLGITVDLV
jgi:hypothetical protein